MKKLNPGDNVYFNDIKGFARLIEADEANNEYRITYTNGIWDREMHHSVVCTVGREDLKLFGSTIPTPKVKKAKVKTSKTTKKVGKAKKSTNETQLKSILDLLD